MVLIPFATWRPDINDTGGQHTQLLRGVIPRDDGYGPWQALQAFTKPLPSRCRGYFIAQRPDGSIAIFAGTVDRLYMLDNTTFDWVDVSRGGLAYTPLSTDANWRFAQFNNFVLATQRNDVLQRLDLTTTNPFVNCPGSPPQAGDIAVINRFLVLGDLLDDPFRVQWSGLNDVTQWTAGVGLSDFQDLPDGGRVRRIADMSQDVGLILQESMLRRMAFAAGSEVIFQIDRLREDVGIFAPYSLVTVAGQAFFLSPKGFIQAGIDGSTAAIGEEQVDRTFLGLNVSAPEALGDLAYDNGAPQLIIGASDPRNNRIVWAYKSITGMTDAFDRAMVYHWTRKRWSPIQIAGEYLAQVARPGLTLEALDAVAPGAIAISGVANNGVGLIRLTVASTAPLTTGDFRTVSGVGGVPNANGNWILTVIDATHVDLQGSTFAGAYTSGGVIAGSLDALPFSLDSVSTATLPGLSAFDADSQLGFFSGTTIEARLETPEQRAEGMRVNVNGLWPRTDAPAVFGLISKRENLSADPEDTPESEMLEDGFVPLLEEARNGRGVIRIPAGTAWSYARGIEMDTEQAGAW